MEQENDLDFDEALFELVKNSKIAGLGEQQIFQLIEIGIEGEIPTEVRMQVEEILSTLDKEGIKEDTSDDDKELEEDDSKSLFQIISEAKAIGMSDDEIYKFITTAAGEEMTPEMEKAFRLLISETTPDGEFEDDEDIDEDDELGDAEYENFVEMISKLIEDGKSNEEIIQLIEEIGEAKLPKEAKILLEGMISSVRSE